MVGAASASPYIYEQGYQVWYAHIHAHSRVRRQGDGGSGSNLELTLKHSDFCSRSHLRTKGDKSVCVCVYGLVRAHMGGGSCAHAADAR